MYIYIYVCLYRYYVRCSWFLPVGKILVLKSCPSSGENKHLDMYGVFTERLRIFWETLIIHQKYQIREMSRKKIKLDGGFNPFEKYESHGIIFPGRGENKKRLKPPPSKGQIHLLHHHFVVSILRIWVSGVSQT